MRINTWTDIKGNPWPVVVNTSLIRDCREQLGVELLDVPEVFRKLALDVPLLNDVLYLACKPLATDRGFTAVTFAELLRGDVWDQATDAISGAIIDFFPSSRREVLLGLREKMATVSQEGTAIGLRQIQNPKLEAAIKMSMQRAEAEIEAQWEKLGGASTSSPAVSE